MCDLNYAIEDTTAFAAYPIGGNLGVQPSDIALPKGKDHGICPDYDSAFSVGLGYLFNCGRNDVTVTYTRLYTTDHSHVAAQGSGGLWVTYGHPRFTQWRLNNAAFIANFTNTTGIPAEAAARVRFEYNMVDGVIGARTTKGCDLWLRGYVGLRWAQIRLNKAVDYQGSIAGIFISEDPGTSFAESNGFAAAFQADPHSRAEVWGVGPRVGLDLRYAIACGFGVGAHCGVSLLVGETSYRFAERIEYNDLDFATHAAGTEISDDVNVPFTGLLDDLFGESTSQTTDVTHNAHCHLIPEVDARLGLNYLFCCGDCFSLMLEVGWEFVSYINALARVAFDDETGHSREVCESYNMDGLYVSFKLSI